MKRRAAGSEHALRAGALEPVKETARGPKKTSPAKVWGRASFKSCIPSRNTEAPPNEAEYSPVVQMLDGIVGFGRRELLPGWADQLSKKARYLRL